MASIFQMGAPFCVFKAQDGLGTQQSVSFARSSYSVNSAAEAITSWTGIGEFSVDLQPVPAGVQRIVQGIVREVAYVFYVLGNPDLRDGDRCYISAQQLEVISTKRYGTMHLEGELRFIGR